MQEYIEGRKQAFREKCTRCGECFAICPIVPFTPLQGEDPEKMTRLVMDLLTDSRRAQEAVTWTASCTMCGACIGHCPESLNPRELLYLAKNLVGMEGATVQGFFTVMSQGVRLLAHLQVAAPDFRRLISPLGWGTAKAEVLFYYGCNVLRTPDILLTAIDILHRLGVSFGVLGGMANCCGVVHFRLGDIKKAEQVENLTYEHWLSFSPQRVLLWCPSCEVQFLEGGLVQRRHPPFAVEHYAKFLAGRVEELKRLYVKEIRRRAVLHEHAGLELGQQVKNLLLSIPGLELVEVPQLKEHSYTCGIGSLSLAAKARDEVHRRLLEEAAAAGIDLLVTPDHGCHMCLCGEEARYPFQVRNFVSVVGEALGIEREDLFKRYMLCGDAEKVVEAAGGFVRENRLDAAAVKGAVWETLTWVR